MEKKIKKDKKVKMHLVIALIVLGLSFICFAIIYSINKNKDKGEYPNVNPDAIDIIDNSDYEFGKEVTISKLAKITNAEGFEIEEDCSKWNVLSADNNLITLYSSALQGNSGRLPDGYKELYAKYGVKVEEVRLLREGEIKLFGCNVETKTCDDMPEWAKGSLTNFAELNTIYVFPGAGSDGKLGEIPNDDTITAPIRPVIVIKKSELE